MKGAGGTIGKWLDNEVGNPVTQIGGKQKQAGGGADKAFTMSELGAMLKSGGM